MLRKLFKSIVLFVALAMCTCIMPSNLSGNNNGSDNIIGIWITAKKDSKIEISKGKDGTFLGKLVWVQPPNQSFEGAEVMRGVTYDAKEKHYVCPWLYSPKMKVEARATMVISGNTLQVKIKKGIVTANREFTRVE